MFLLKSTRKTFEIVCKVTNYENMDLKCAIKKCFGCIGIQWAYPMWLAQGQEGVSTHTLQTTRVQHRTPYDSIPVGYKCVQLTLPLQIHYNTLTTRTTIVRLWCPISGSKELHDTPGVTPVHDPLRAGQPRHPQHLYGLTPCMSLRL